jgi:hypothetical protein
MIMPSREMGRFIAAKSRKGAKCAECATIFTRDKGDGKVVAMFRNTGRSFSVYVLCAHCGAGYKKAGKRAIPNAVRDSYIASVMRPNAPKRDAPVWIN